MLPEVPTTKKELIMLDLLLSTVGQGLQWSILALGVFLSFRVLDAADLSVEGSFPLGAAVASSRGSASRSPFSLPLWRGAAQAP